MMPSSPQRRTSPPSSSAKYDTIKHGDYEEDDAHGRRFPVNKRDRADDDDKEGKKRRKHASDSDEDNDDRGRSRSRDSSEESGSRKRRKSRRKEKKKSKSSRGGHGKRKSKTKRRRRSRSRSTSRSSSSSRSGSESSGSSGSSPKEKQKKPKKETKEERRQRKLEKKKAKEERFAGYTNDENPFGDMNLHQPFVWKKKLHKEVKEGKRKKMPKEHELKDQRNELISEIEKVKKRREQREAEKEEQQRLKAEEERLKQQASFGDWAAKEELFQIQQLKRRSLIRIQDGREQPIDLLAKNLLLCEAGRGDDDELEDDPTMEVELTEPHEIVDRQNLDDLEKLEEDVNDYYRAEERALNAAKMEGNEKAIQKAEDAIEYWKLLLVLCSDTIRRRKSEYEGRRVGIGGIHPTVEDDVHNMFTGKSYNDLKKMETEINEKLDTARERAEERVRNATQGFNADGVGQEGRSQEVVDVEYWEGVKSALAVYQARARLRSIHERLLIERLDQLKAKKKLTECSRKIKEEAKDQEFGEAEAQDETQQEERQLKTEQQESAIKAAVSDGISAQEAEQKGVGDREETLGEQSQVPTETSDMHLWADKYRPRKPRYFNRVKTGWDWNQYNKTHYDKETPPPKIVQGYKFNIFYPDLIDKTQTPTYFLEPADSPEFCIIRFRAGPPYEDIAFKIVNKEWSTQRKHGFRCTFDRGILQLHFNFKKARYRR